jgi:hypothetical protein
MLSCMLTAVLKAVKILLSCCPKKSQDAAVLTDLKAVQDVVLTALKAVQDAEKKITPTKTKYKDLFPSASTKKYIYKEK